MCKGVCNQAPMPDGEMEMRIFGEPREADAAERLPSLDMIAGLYLQAATGQMAVLGFPMFRMFDQDAVAAFDIADRFTLRFAESAVWRAVARAENATACGSENFHAGLLCLQ